MNNNELKLDKRIIKRIESKLINHFNSDWNYESKQEVSHFIIDECLFGNDLEDTNEKYGLNLIFTKGKKTIVRAKKLKNTINLYVLYFMNIDWKFENEFDECDYLKLIKLHYDQEATKLNYLKGMVESYE